MSTGKFLNRKTVDSNLTPNVDNSLHWGFYQLNTELEQQSTRITDTKRDSLPLLDDGSMLPLD